MSGKYILQQNSFKTAFVIIRYSADYRKMQFYNIINFLSKYVYLWNICI